MIPNSSSSNVGGGSFISINNSFIGKGGSSMVN
jgi:hypothetical protein